MRASTSRHATPATDGLAKDPAAALGVPALVRGVLVIRWAVLVWMAIVLMAAVLVDGRPAAGGPMVGLVLVAGWVVWLTVSGPPRSTPELVADLVIAAALIIVGSRDPWFATVYPVTAALAWGAARGVVGGIVAGAILGVVSVVAGLSVPGGPSSAQLIPVLRDPVNFLLAGGGLGFVATLLDRSAAQVREAQAAQVRATERAARATERESLGRQIHDSVLQTLALVHKRGRELAADDVIASGDVARLADLAASQERALRALILRPPDEARPDDTRAPLRDQLERAAAAAGTDPAVTVVGDIRLPVAQVRELGAAVEQALSNVARHADARHAWVFAEVDDGQVVVCVRDDGRGFTFDEAALRASGKFGLLRSIRGRVEDLGGSAHVDTAPGRGTELELRLPLSNEEDDDR